MVNVRLSLAFAASIFALLALSLAACGDDSPAETADAAPINLFDAAEEPPDAAPPIDAFACVEETCAGDCCSNFCVDTTTDELNCGGCGEGCEAGELCNESKCACPPGFVPESLDSGTIQDISQFVPNVMLTISQFGVAGVPSGVIITFPKDGLELNTALPLQSDFTPPFAVAGYDVDLQSTPPSAGSAFWSTAGTITFEYACAEGVAGIIENATFSPVLDLLNPTPTESVCTFQVTSLPFAYGTPCTTSDIDAGVEIDAGEIQDGGGT